MKPSECEAWRRIEGWLSEQEADALFEAATGVPSYGRIVEIGAYKGRSTYAMALACAGRGVKLFAVDPFTGNPKEESAFPRSFKADFDRNLADFIKNNVVCALVMSSGGASMLEIHPDLVFIDGSHIYEDALFDMVTWWKKLHPDGRMGIHDSASPNVQAALLSFLKQRGLHTEFVTGSIAWLRKATLNE